MSYLVLPSKKSLCSRLRSGSFQMQGFQGKAKLFQGIPSQWLNMAGQLGPEHFCPMGLLQQVFVPALPVRLFIFVRSESLPDPASSPFLSQALPVTPPALTPSQHLLPGGPDLT